jgi:predicted  nucleic acid-binding Zn-ribbon protein
MSDDLQMNQTPKAKIPSRKDSLEEKGNEIESSLNKIDKKQEIISRSIENGEVLNNELQLTVKQVNTKVEEVSVQLAVKQVSRHHDENDDD